MQRRPYDRHSSSSAQIDLEKSAYRSITAKVRQ
jgi:hypothetical protein